MFLGIEISFMSFGGIGYVCYIKCVTFEYAIPIYFWEGKTSIDEEIHQI